MSVKANMTGTRTAKICGVRTPEHARLAARGDAVFIGFIHHPKSPRHLALSEMATLFEHVRAEGVRTPLVTVVCDPEDILLDTIITNVRPDLIQLHGHETPERVAAIAGKGTGLIKAISVADASDVTKASAFEPFVQYLLFDAKTPASAPLPGGMGVSFDWSLMRHYAGHTPWLLAGGLNADTIGEAARQSGAMIFDVSSGVESAPGVKDAGLISSFLNAVKSL